MKRISIASITLVAALLLVACGTVTGTAVGAGIGSISGNTKAGAMIGGGAVCFTTSSEEGERA